jgi:cytochrome c peroxidase
VAVLSGAAALRLATGHDVEPVVWTTKERRAIERLSLVDLPTLPPDPTNRVADDPAAAKLGHELFFDRGLSANGRVSCSSCHMPERGFQDGRPFGTGIGETTRRTMPLAGAAYARWLFWDGRRDSLWAQALTPLESGAEHGITRTFAARWIAVRYRHEYEAVFGPLPSAVTRELPVRAGPLGSPGQRRAWRRLTSDERLAVDEVFANLGKAVEAYERRLEPGASRFDRFAAALARGDAGAARRLLSGAEQRGLRLFVGEARCTNCHSGPLFTNGEFHNTGIPQSGNADVGRAAGAQAVASDPFNCLGRFSDARPVDCSALRFLVVGEERLRGEFKVPSLRDVGSRSPYMHAGQFDTLRDVLDHYRRAAVAPVGVSELHPLDLSDAQLGEIEAFLRTLDGGVDAPRRFLRPS